MVRFWYAGADCGAGLDYPPAVKRFPHPECRDRNTFRYAQLVDPSPPYGMHGSSPRHSLATQILNDSDRGAPADPVEVPQDVKAVLRLGSP